ncbi:EthD family reductase [Mycolicibacterium rufum]|uniref:EthD family reductase n=1 Tax=Mycolicibacterium rufum TaxID=318424 RepID=A0A9X2YEA1_9MYCO|nr:EthD family reductase [Mycolicibacterium rufum]KGI70491.1 ethyl tert-butyl ether degradation protein EthD [Mycolicibacterium rufum]MCV7071705.1 EthD family reductase [Mycolicibacterium rufum]ULP36831.1 EthD family reductase [Mycolicibacterium rufum]
MSETKITVIYDNPLSAEDFESSYPEEQLAVARSFPGHIRVEASKVWPKEDGSPTPAYRMIDLYYPDYASASEAVTSPEAARFFDALGRIATGGVRVLFSDIEVPQR